MNKIKELLSEIEEASGFSSIHIDYFSDGSGTLWNGSNYPIIQLIEFDTYSDIEQELEKYLESCKE